jgi:hypothetical protein
MKDADEIVRYLPPEKRALLERAAAAGRMSIGAAVAYSLAADPIKEYCPPHERAKVAGLLMRAFLDDEKKP